MSQSRHKRRVKTPKTPIRDSIKQDSKLQQQITDGLGAVAKAHHCYFIEKIRPLFSDSLNIDEAFRQGREQENRWDYLLGNKNNNKIIGVEPHSATNGEITTVINKRKYALRQLKDHIKDGRNVSKWLWVASGTVKFMPLEKNILRLDQNGIKFVGKQIKAKDLD